MLNLQKLKTASRKHHPTSLGLLHFSPSTYKWHRHSWGFYFCKTDQKSNICLSRCWNICPKALRLYWPISLDERKQKIQMLYNLNHTLNIAGLILMIHFLTHLTQFIYSIFHQKQLHSFLFCFTFYYLFGTKFNQRWKINESMNYIDNNMTWRFSEKSDKLEFTSRISISIGPWRLENSLPSCGKSSYLPTFSPPINSTSMGKFMLCTGAIKNICVPRRKSSRLGLQNCLWISASRMGLKGWRHLYKRKLAFGQSALQ